MTTTKQKLMGATGASLMLLGGIGAGHLIWGGNDPIPVAAPATGITVEDRDAAVTEAVRLNDRMHAGVLELFDLPDGVDRDAAAKAEIADQGYAFLDAEGCSIVLRMSWGGVLDVYPGIDEVGGEADRGLRDTGCVSDVRLPPGPPRPPVSERPERWEAAIRGAEAYTYRDGDHIRVDISRCAGFNVPADVDMAGVAVPETVPAASAEFCNR